MNTMEITKYVGAFCGSLLVFLLISTASSSIFDTSSDVVAFAVEAPEAEGEAPVESTDTPDEVQADTAELVAAADPAAGEAVFKRCAACHKVDGTDAVGPHLNGVVGRDKGSAEGFRYSTAMAAAEGVWDENALYAFLENPKAYVPGTSMSFAGLSKSEDRANVIAYLETLSN
jgi:cytochrome c